MTNIDNKIDNFFDNSHVPEDASEPQEGSLDLSAHKLIKEEEEIIVNMDGGVGGSWETKPINPVEYYAQRLSRKVETEHTHVDLFAPQPNPNTPSFVGIHKPSTENSSTHMTEEDFGNRLRMVEKRISDVALTMGEVKSLSEANNTTLVHGIGASGDGSNSPGSGEVMLQRLDDVSMDGIVNGDTLGWNGTKFVPIGSGGGGGTGGATRTSELNLDSPSLGNFFAAGDNPLSENFPISGDYTTQMDANTAFVDTLNYLEDNKANITLSTTEPTLGNESAGDLWLDDAYGLHVYDGTIWQSVSTGAGTGGPYLPLSGGSLSGTLTIKDSHAINFEYNGTPVSGIMAVGPDHLRVGSSTKNLELKGVKNPNEPYDGANARYVDDAVTAVRTISLQNQSDISEINEALDGISASRRVGTYSVSQGFNGDTPATGTIIAVDSSDWSVITTVRVNETNQEGETLDFTGYEAGDIIDLQNTDGSGGVTGTVVSISNFSTTWNIEYTITKSKGNIGDVRLLMFKTRTDDIDVIELDARYDEKYLKVNSSGNITTHDDDNDFRISRVSGSSTAYVFSVSANQLEADKQIAFRVTNDGKVKAGYNSDNPFLATDDNDVTTKKFTETNYIRLGGTNNVEQHNFKIRTHKASDNTDFFTYIDISEGEMALYHVKTPTEGVHAANKKYVDDEIAKIPASSGGGLPVELVNSFPASPTRGQLYMNPSNVLVVGV